MDLIVVNAMLYLGIQTSQDARFYAVSSKLDKSFSNKGKSLVLQFTVKHEQSIDCGGGYIKVNWNDSAQFDHFLRSSFAIIALEQFPFVSQLKHTISTHSTHY